MARFQAMWAQTKGRAKSEMKRRVESAKMASKLVGIPMKKSTQPR